MPGYVTADASIGIRKDHWGATFFCNNLADSHASTYTSSAQFIESKVPLRPRVYGLKLDFDY
jgi:outer membrane receptor protein involved in Fe transport